MPQCNKYNETELIGRSPYLRGGNATEGVRRSATHIAQCARDLMLLPDRCEELGPRSARETHEKLLAILFLSVSIRAIKT